MSSDSSDDEDLARLREAADSQFINDSMFHQKSNKNSKTVEEEPPIELPQSLRYSKDEDEQFNLFHVSSEFRDFVAKHLSTILDNVLEKQLVSSNTLLDNNTKSKKRKSGVKLFHNSPTCIRLKTKEVRNNNTPIIKRTINCKNSSDPISDDQLRLVAVSSEDILSKRDTKYWSTRSKAPVFTYVKTKDGLMLK